MMSELILDTGVVSILANPDPSGEDIELKKYYEKKASGFSWCITPTINSEINRMRSIEGRRDLWRHCRRLLSSPGTAVRRIEWTSEMEELSSSPDFVRSFKGHTNIRDRRIAAAAKISNIPILCHDEEFYNSAKLLEGVVVYSKYGESKKRAKSVRRGRKGRTRETI